MFKRTNSLLAPSLVVAAIVALLSCNPSTSQAQVRRVMIEEFTGAWCGFCPSGELSIKQLKAAYPGQVIAVSFHGNQGNPLNDQMDVPQGDTLRAGIPTLASATQVASYPDGWIARNAYSGTWNTNPSNNPWIDTVIAGNGLAEQLLGQKPTVTVSVDHISYDVAAGTITARVTAKFSQAMSGDLRFNLYLIEDSVTGSGQGWDQHSYWYTDPASPYYNVGTPFYYNGALDGSTIPGWEHMQVFRYSPGPIWGTTGVIPSSVSAGGTYSQTYTFNLPASVQDTNHVKLIGFVSKYSSSNLSGNEILDADQEPLVGLAPKYFLTNILVTGQNQYATATSNGTTPQTILFTNNGSDPVTLSLSVKAGSLPAGWSATLSPDTITVNAGTSGNAILNITAPEQSAYVVVTVLATPVKEGYITATSQGSICLLSDNTRYAMYIPSKSAYEAAAYLGTPDSVKLHMAIMPLTSDILQNYDYTQFGAIILNSIPILDFSADLGLGVAPSAQLISDMLAAGSRIFLNSDDALGYAFDQSDPYFSQFTSYTETSSVQTLFQQLGIDWTRTVRRWNTSTGTLTPFAIKGTSDPIGTGISVTDGGGYLSEIYSIDSNSIPLFYSDGASKNILGSRYEDPNTHGRLVYLGFGLSELTNQKLADTIMKRSINWLLSNSSADVNAPAIAPVAGITASPNPFHGVTQIQYVATPDERNVTLGAYDLLGREVATLPTHSAGDNSYIATFDGSKLADGTYVIIAHSSKGMSQVRIVNQQ